MKTPLILTLVFVTGFAIAGNSLQAGPLRGAAMSAGVTALLGGSKKSVRNAAVAGAIIGGVSKNKRKK
ncbi:MAG: hypothetical protein ACPGNV_11830 [Mangrovicoccus sp.]